MRCTTCHDPHEKVSKDTTRYERLCLDCHKTQNVAACPESSNNCIQCHMPPISLEGVASFHDHWIRIRNEQDPSVLQPEVDLEE
jgi:predicted CXXCH cytochrome family protein